MGPDHPHVRISKPMVERIVIDVPVPQVLGEVLVSVDGPMPQEKLVEQTLADSVNESISQHMKEVSR